MALKQKEKLEPMTIFASRSTGLLKIHQKDSGITVEPISKLEADLFADLNSMYRDCILNGKTSSLNEFLTVKRESYKQNPTEWHVVFVNLASRLEDAGYYFQAGLCYERMIDLESNGETKSMYSQKAIETYRKGIIIYAESKNYDGIRNCLDRGLPLAFKQGRLGDYAVMIREAPNVSTNASSYLNKFKENLTFILATKKDNLTEENVEELFTTLLFLQEETGYVSDAFITGELKVHFNKLPENLKEYAAEIIKSSLDSRSSWGTYAKLFETEKMKAARVKREKEEKRGGDVRFAINSISSYAITKIDSSNLNLNNLLNLRLEDEREYNTALNKIANVKLKQKLSNLIEEAIDFYSIVGNNEAVIKDFSSKQKGELGDLQLQGTREIETIFSNLIKELDTNKNGVFEMYSEDPKGLERFYSKKIETSSNKIKEISNGLKNRVVSL